MRRNGLLATALLCLGQAAFADNAILVLDASGSMWAQIEGKTKIEIARSAVAAMLKTWPQGHQLGLVAYGHRSKGDCADIETLLPVATLDASTFQDQVNALSPKGMTPISAAVQHAAAALKSSEEKATVILVSDGEETCKLDPCLIAKTLEANSIDFTAHVIGFDVAKNTTADRQLQCLATATGGRYLNASNAQELSGALDQLSKTTPTTKPDATLDAPATAPRGSRLAVHWTGPNAELDAISLVEVNSQARSSYVYVRDGNPALLNLPGKPGNYLLHYRHRDLEVLATRTIVVTEAQASLEAPASAPIDTEIAVHWIGPAAELDTIVIAKVGDDGYESYTYVSSENPVRLTTPSTPGQYELRYKLRDSEVIAVRAIEVKAN